jgi:outer membrane receptor protein involved in Fe transport
LATEYKFKKNYNLKAGINNVFNEQYTTRRASGYPGPGILPGEGQTFYLSVGKILIRHLYKKGFQNPFFSCSNKV